MDEQKQSIIDRIKQAQNILVTVSKNPTVDQLAASIGLTLALNKVNKRGTTVFSGNVPSTLDFLKPEETIEKTADSLRDFIIALDKSKADRLRYKVEDDVVRIFITPYKTSLSEDDLNFSQGDYNVDVVVCLGVNSQQELDEAVTAHGRILHDATVASISLEEGEGLGTLHWSNTQASSLSEMVTSLIDGLDKSALDEQIATALLTGIVANTDRFRNEKTTPATMSLSAELMSAGANQQLIASELESSVSVGHSSGGDKPAKPKDTDLSISHDTKTTEQPDEDAAKKVESNNDNATVDTVDDGHPKISGIHGGHALLPDPAEESGGDEEGQGGLPSNDMPALSHNESVLTKSEEPAPQAPPESPAPVQPPDVDAGDRPTPLSGSDVNEQVVEQAQGQTKVEDDPLAEARQAVEMAQAKAASAPPLPPVTALNAQPLVDNLHEAKMVEPTGDVGADSMDMPLPAAPLSAQPPVPPQDNSGNSSAPPVPPPFIPPIPK